MERLARLKEERVLLTGIEDPPWGYAEITVTELSWGLAQQRGAFNDELVRAGQPRSKRITYADGSVGAHHAEGVDKLTYLGHRCGASAARLRRGGKPSAGCE